MQQDTSTPWQYKPEGGSAASGPTTSAATDSSRPKTRSPKNVTWEATEFIEHHHGLSWYVVLVLITAGLAALVYFAVRDIFATAIMIIVGCIVGVFAGQKPGKASYEITASGINVNGKLYGFGNYKSFTVVRESDLSGINFFPLKRLTPPLTAYFDPKDEQKIITAVGNYLPYEDRKLDSIDRLARRLRL